MRFSTFTGHRVFKAFRIAALLGLALPLIHCGETKQPSQLPADNSGKNIRDTKQGPPTPENQNENKTDLELTQKIRQAIVAEDSFSMNAKNVKIITANGVVTLRGPVANAREKELIASLAKQVAGVTSVEDQLEIINP